MMIHVHRGKGAKDRYVPLPHSTFHLLRQYWRTHRHPRLVFPALGRKRTAIHEAIHPMAKNSVQGAFRQAKWNAGVRKKGVSRFSVWKLRNAVDMSLVRNLERTDLGLSFGFNISTQIASCQSRDLPDGR
jgi:integrase